MRYLTEPKYRKYVERYGFLWFVGKFDDKYVEQLMDTTTKTGVDAAKTVSKRIRKNNNKTRKVEEFKQQIIDDLKKLREHHKMQFW